jgi:hypothetical protein
MEGEQGFQIYFFFFKGYRIEENFFFKGYKIEENSMIRLSGLLLIWTMGR